MDRNQRMSRLSKMREEAHRKWVCWVFNSLSLGGMGPISTLKVCVFGTKTHGTSLEAYSSVSINNFGCCPSYMYKIHAVLSMSVINILVTALWRVGLLATPGG